MEVLWLHHPAAQAVSLYDEGFSLRAFISLNAHSACSLCVLQPATLSASLRLSSATRRAADAATCAAAAPRHHSRATAAHLSSPSSEQVLGRQLVQYAKHIGIRTINVVRRDEHIEDLKALG